VRDGNPYLDANGNEFGDNAVRFAALAQAATRISTGETSIRVPHIVHAHDWHAGLTPLFLHAAGLKRPKSIITIHNLAFQGVFPMDTADTLGIPHSYRGADGAEFWGQFSFLKAGLRYADRITTVSETYAREILTPKFGHGLDGLLNARKDDLSAIPNGIDADIWDPVLDPFLTTHFSAMDMRGKIRNKLELQQSFGLTTDPEAPLMVMGSRLTSQKMADVAVDAFPRLLDAHPRLQIAVLGCGERPLEEAFTALQERYEHRFAINVGYDERSAHLLHAGADMLLHGSRFEPFGLTPIYSMLYGTIPIASRIGGLADTIIDAPLSDEITVGNSTGVLFDGETVGDMVNAVERTLSLFSNPATWTAMQKNGMTTNFGWEQSAAKYVELYRTLAPAPVVATPVMTWVTGDTHPTESVVSPQPVAAPQLASERNRA
jgi:starch synthase